MRRSVLAILGLGVLLATPAAAESTTIRVAVAQTDLATPEAVDSLYQRIVQAADSVCVASGAAFAGERRACRAETLEAALEQANIAPLSARHEGAHEAAMTTTAAAR